MAVSQGEQGGRFSRLAVLVAVGVTLGSGCREVEPRVTAVRIAASWPSAMMIDQLALELRDDEGQMMGPRELRPQIPAAPLQPGADVVVYLRDGYGGRWLSTTVQGLSGGQVVAAGEGQVAVVASAVADLQVSLSGNATDGGPGDGSPSDGPVPGDGPAPGDVPGMDARPADTTTADARDLVPADRPPGSQANGQPCDDPIGCRSGHCTDGVCCEVASCGTCRTCNLAGTPGVCKSVPAGAPEPRGACPTEPVSSCGSNGKCDGAGACQKYPANTVCDAARCHSSGGGVVVADLCDGAGVCVNSGTDFCEGGFGCNPANLTCFTSCTSAAQCPVDKVCRSNRCE